ncbi:MAG: hypothetical protein PHY92_00225 [Alphaproteobacteria bacterium]|nr:hypothetical protein [Alphaproteobacteria bacterium]
MSLFRKTRSIETQVAADLDAKKAAVLDELLTRTASIELLTHYAWKGMTSHLLALLKQNSSILNGEDKNGHRALVLAVRGSHLNTFKALLAQRGLDPNVREYTYYFDPDGRFIDLKTRKYMHRTDGETALMEIMSSGHRMEYLVELLRNPATDPNIQDENGNTAFMKHMDRLDMLEILMADSRTKPEIRNKKGQTALDIAHEKLTQKMGDKFLIDLAGVFERAAQRPIERMIQARDGVFPALNQA